MEQSVHGETLKWAEDFYRENHCEFFNFANILIHTLWHCVATVCTASKRYNGDLLL